MGRSKEERKACVESLSSWKISYAGGKCCASVEQRQFQVINVLPLPALGKSGTLVGDLYNFVSKLYSGCGEGLIHKGRFRICTQEPSSESKMLVWS